MNETQNRPDIRLIALDMDGTLLNSEQEISHENAKALGHAHGRGAQIAIVSGRAPHEIAGYTRYIPDIPVHILGLNGAFIRAVGGEDRITYLPGDIFTQCVRLTARRGFRYFFYTDEALYTNRPDGKDRVLEARGVSDAEAVALAGRAVKFVAGSTRAEALLALRAEIAKLDVSISSSWHTNFEVNAQGVNKGGALRDLAARLGIPRECVMAAGDQENDLTMLAWAGVPVAMENAIESVKRLAAYQTGHHNEHGVARAIYHFIE